MNGEQEKALDAAIAGAEAESAAAKKKEDGRSKTSAANGAAGGRPKKFKAGDFVNAFIERLQGETRAGVVTLRRWHETWYRYQGGRYHKITDESLWNDISAFIRTGAHFECHTPNLVTAVQNTLRGNDCCGVPEEVDMPCWLPSGEPAKNWLALSNCLVDVEALAAGRIDEATAEFSPELFTTFGADFEYNPSAPCPLWHKYLEEVLPDPEDRKMVQMLFGLCLVADTSYDVFFVFYGDGGTGKTVCAEVLRGLIGKANVSNLDLVELAEKHGKHVLTETRLNIGSEIPNRIAGLDLADAESHLKKAASGEAIKCELKNKDIYFRDVTARLLFLTNNLPTFSDQSSGLWRRIRLIPFFVKIAETKKCDRNLKDKLMGELSGIFNWAVEGLAMLREYWNHFPSLGKGKEIIEQHRAGCDKERTFLTDAFTPATASSFVEASQVYQKYKNFCEDNGYRPKGQNQFAADIRRCFPSATSGKEYISAVQKRVWYGIASLAPVEPPEEDSLL